MTTKDKPQTAAQLLIRSLVKQNVKYIFGIPGGKIMPTFDVLWDEGPQLIVCRHEQNAAFMAAAVGRLTGRPGVCLVTSGPGTGNLVTGAATATTEGDPMVAIGGVVSLPDALKQTHQSMDSVAIMKPVTKFNVAINAPEAAGEAVVNAFRAAMAPRAGASFIAFPKDVQRSAAEANVPPLLPLPSLGAAPTDLDFSCFCNIESDGRFRPGKLRPAASGCYDPLLMWGFLTCLNDILVPHLKAIFDLSYAKVMLIQFAFFSAYFLFSIPWSKVVNTIGYQKTMVVGLLTMAAGAFLFLPAASAASFPLFLTALIILAAGITGLQVAANPYVVVLGKPETASSRLDLTQAFNSLGTTIAPKLGGLLILAGVPLAIEELRQLTPQALHAYRVQEAASVKLPYTVIGIALILLAVLIGSFKLPKIETAAYQSRSNRNDSIWRHPNLLLGAIGIFTYVGAEVAIGSFLVNYFGQADIANLSAKTAAGYVSFYWGGAMVGRFLGAGLLRRFKPGSLLGFCAIAAALLVTISMAATGHVAMWTILAVGLFNSIMFPTIFSLGVAELGALTGNASGLLNMAIVGGAILPVLQGVIADRVGIHHAFVLPVLCYLYILFYGVSGSRPNSQRYGTA